MVDDQQDNHILELLGKHGGLIHSLSADIRSVSMDVLVLRAMIYGLMLHAKETGIDLRPACMAMRDHIPEEHQASFVARLKTMYGIDLPA